MIYTKFQYISQGQTATSQEKNIRQALDHGAQWVQLRWKEADDQAFLKLAERIKIVCKNHNAIFIINDRVDIAKTIDSDGVHLGLHDMPIWKARRILGSKKIIGGTANTFQDVLQRTEEGCHYIGLGPFRFTSTKKKLSPVLGAIGYRNILKKLNEKNIQSPPIFAIGGIVLNDIPCIKTTGIHGIALSRLVTEQPQIIPHIKTLFQ